MTTEERSTTFVNEMRDSIICKMKFAALVDWGGCLHLGGCLHACNSIVPGSRPLGMVCPVRKVTVLDLGACILETPCRRIQEYFKPMEAVK
jgi:hypothetical protein